jgi:hypothetical protein
MIIAQQLSKVATFVVFTVLGSIITTSSANAASIYLDPIPYKSSHDSPFHGGDYSYFYQEDFEDGFLNTPGVTASGGRVLPPQPSNLLTDSVDGDDAVIDGSGSEGYSWYSDGNSTLRFTFNSGVLGALPTNVGIVWSDVGFADSTFGFGQVNLEAFDAFGASLGIFGPTAVGDGQVSGQTLEDRFFGVVHGGGISAIQISMLDSTDWEVDHLQYGRVSSQSVPEPATLWSSLIAGVVGVKWRSHRQRQLAKKIYRQFP